MEDIKQMIENAKQKLADEKEKARKLVEENERLNAELEAALMPAQAPSPSATELDRIVAVVDKINEKADITDKLRVQSVAGLRKGIEMLGGSDDLLLISKAQVDAAIASAINALPKSPTRKDITATYETRKWNANDAGKKVYITFDRAGIIIMKVGFISEGVDTKFSDGKAVVDLGINYTNATMQERLFWSTEHVSQIGSITLYTTQYNALAENFYWITKFEIEE